MLTIKNKIHDILYMYNNFFCELYIYNEPVYVKSGLNGIQTKIQITALQENINFCERFLKI